MGEKIYENVSKENFSPFGIVSIRLSKINTYFAVIIMALFLYCLNFFLRMDVHKNLITLIRTCRTGFLWR